MNLIIFVMSLIMVLSAMSWSTLSTFFKHEAEAQEWVWLMHESERSIYNREQKNCLIDKKEKAASKPQEETQPKDDKAKKDAKPATAKTTTSKGTGKISLAWLVDKKAREDKPKEWAEMKEIIEKIMVSRWSDQPFYKRLIKQRPDFVKAIIYEMEALSEKGSEQNLEEGSSEKDGKVKNEKPKIKDLGDLILLNWPDYSLKEAFGRMLQPGLIYKKSQKAKDKLSQDDQLNALPEVSAKGFQSLNDFFTTQKSDKIRLWLASEPVLEALFEDPETVKEVIKVRGDLYKEARKEDAKLADLTMRFKDAFSSKTAYPDRIDFTVTKTDPRR